MKVKVSKIKTTSHCLLGILSILWFLSSCSSYRKGADAVVNKNVRNYLKGNSTPGAAIGVIYQGRELYYNYGNIGDGKTKIAKDTLFVLCSVQKTFTGTLFGEQIAKGNITLDKPIGPILGVSKKSALQNISGKALATYTSGMKDSYCYKLQKLSPGYELYRNLPPADSTYYVWNHDLTKPNIPKYKYSNFGMVTLGFAVANSSKFGNYMPLFKEVIKDPLGMKNTVIDIGQYPESLIAIGHNKSGNPIPNSSRGSGFSSTSYDMLQFLKANLFMKPVSKTLSEGMKLAQKKMTEKNGLAWFIENGIIFKDGDNEGFSNFIVFDPTEKIAVVILTNGKPPKGQEHLKSVASKIIKELKSL